MLGQEFDPIGFIEDPADPLVTQTEQQTLPEAHVLHQNYPNPFSGQTTITFTLRSTEEVMLEVYDLSGRQVYKRSLGQFVIRGNIRSDLRPRTCRVAHTCTAWYRWPSGLLSQDGGHLTCQAMAAAPSDISGYGQDEVGGIQPAGKVQFAG